MSDMTSVFAEITKSTPQEDGSLLVYGKATGSDLDMDEQRCDATWLSTAMPEWFRTAGNVREQHDAKRAVGKAIEHETTDDGSHMIRARIVDPIAKAKVEAGILSGFSIGIKSPRIDKSVNAKNGTIVGGQIVEISLVDRPCLPTATLTMCKAAAAGWEGSPADLDEDLGLVKCEELTEVVGEMVIKAGESFTPEQLKQYEGMLDKTAEPVVEETQKTADAEPEEAVKDADKAVDAEEVVAEAEAPAAEPAEFDAEAAKALVAETLAKADAGGDDEQSDIDGAQSAIAIIAKLIASEASDLAENAGEACDIQLLLQAVSALRCFQGREQAEQGGSDSAPADDAVVLLAADADVEKAETVEKAKYTADELRSMLAAGKAMKNPDGDPSYPIGDVEDLENAIHAVGRGKGDHDAIRSYIKGRAKALGKSDLIPDSWDSSSKTVEPETDGPADEATKTVEPEATKAAAFDEDGLFKSLSGDLEKVDSPLHKLFKSFVEAQATALVEASTKSAAEVTGDLVTRMEKVESMATPGGPALRRTDAEVKRSRQQDLELMALAEERKASSPGLDRDVRDGYLTKAAGFRAQAHAV